MNIYEYTDLKLVEYKDGSLSTFPLHILIDDSPAHENNAYVAEDADCFFFLDNSVLYEHQTTGTLFRPPSRMIYAGEL